MTGASLAVGSLRLLGVLLCAGLAAGQALARCAPFDFYASLGRIPVVVHGRVVQSNQAELAGAACGGPRVCRHRFEVDVDEVLKGRSAHKRLRFEHDYVPQRPEIALFAPGDDYVFAVRRVGADGRAALYGTTCGRAGVGAKDLGKVRQALGRG